MFKEGDSVVYVGSDETNWNNLLTLNNVYTVSFIFQDNDIVLAEQPGTWFKPYNFISLEEDRRRKINRLKDVSKRTEVILNLKERCLKKGIM